MPQAHDFPHVLGRRTPIDIKTTLFVQYIPLALCQRREFTDLRYCTLKLEKCLKTCACSRYRTSCTLSPLPAIPNKWRFLQYSPPSTGASDCALSSIPEHKKGRLASIDHLHDADSRPNYHTGRQGSGTTDAVLHNEPGANKTNFSPLSSSAEVQHPGEEAITPTGRAAGAGGMAGGVVQLDFDISKGGQDAGGSTYQEERVRRKNKIAGGFGGGWGNGRRQEERWGNNREGYSLHVDGAGRGGGGNLLSNQEEKSREGASGLSNNGVFRRGHSAGTLFSRQHQAQGGEQRIRSVSPRDRQHQPWDSQRASEWGDDRAVIPSEGREQGDSPENLGLNSHSYAFPDSSYPRHLTTGRDAGHNGGSTKRDRSPSQLPHNKIGGQDTQADQRPRGENVFASSMPIGVIPSELRQQQEQQRPERDTKARQHGRLDCDSVNIEGKHIQEHRGGTTYGALGGPITSPRGGGYDGAGDGYARVQGQGLGIMGGQAATTNKTTTPRPNNNNSGKNCNFALEVEAGRGPEHLDHARTALSVPVLRQNDQQHLQGQLPNEGWTNSSANDGSGNGSGIWGTTNKGVRGWNSAPSRSSSQSPTVATPTTTMSPTVSTLKSVQGRLNLQHMPKNMPEVVVAAADGAVASVGGIVGGMVPGMTATASASERAKVETKTSIKKKEAMCKAEKNEKGERYDGDNPAVGGEEGRINDRSERALRAFLQGVRLSIRNDKVTQ